MITSITLDDGLSSTIYGTVYASIYSKKEREYTINVFLDFTNERLKVLEYSGTTFLEMASYLNFIARENELSKILFNVREKDWQKYDFPGFEPEARIPSLYNGEPGILLSGFIKTERKISRNLQEEEDIMRRLDNVEPEEPPVAPSLYDIKICEHSDASELSGLYATVFSTYPTPLDSEEYVRYMMSNNVVFLGIYHAGKLISAASGEIDRDLNAAEMTDCATLPEYRGKGLMQILIALLETEMKKRGIITLYSLARAMSTGMNMVFKKASYEFCGRLINNCHICGTFEDMNVWSKSI